MYILGNWKIVRANLCSGENFSLGLARGNIGGGDNKEKDGMLANYMDSVYITCTMSQYFHVDLQRITHQIVAIPEKSIPHIKVSTVCTVYT